MSQTYTRQRKLSSPTASDKAAAPALRQAVSNSALLSALGSSSGTGLDSVTQKPPQIQQRAQAQIPQAENEADRLSASITSGSPEAVKSAMGRRLGADFSGVRFHTGADAASKAASMGARAYTSGADVYFGEGGFEPSVAAHELVHTAQQGIVASSVATIATPAGGVQQLPWGKKSHDEYETIHRIMTGSATHMTADEQNKWMKKHASAVKKYEEKADIRKKAAYWAGKRDLELAQAKNFLRSEEKQDFFKNHSSFIGDTDFDTGAFPTVNAFLGPGTKKETTWNPLKIIRSKVEGAVDDMSSKLSNSSKQAAADFIEKGFGGASDFLEDFSKKSKNETAGSFGDVFGIVSNAVTLSQGIHDVVQGHKQGEGMKNFQREQYGANPNSKQSRKNTRKGLTDLHDRIMWDSSVQAKMASTGTKIKASDNIISGAAGVAGSVASLASAPVLSEAFTTGAKTVHYALDIADKIQAKRIRNKVFAQTTGISDDDITKFQKDNNISSFKRAKQALLKALGYSSGKRSELIADQSARRADYIVSQAQNASSAHHDQVVSWLNSMGIKNSKNTNKLKTKILERMGISEQRSDFF